MTLLELLLALALMAIVVALLGSAIHLHLRVLDVRRTDIEQAQLARAVLRMMADDLRATIQSDPVDFSSVADLAPTMDLESPDLGDLDGLLEDANLDEVDTSATEGISNSVEPPSKPGLYGNCCELRIDVSRLPRPDEYALTPPATAGAPLDIPSEIKSVAYYLTDNLTSRNTNSPGSDTAINGGLVPNSPEGESRGLVRRIMSRAATEWASENGNLDTLRQNARVVAREIIGLEFRYFDGTEWLTEWDTEAEGGLPVAVEIAIRVESPEAALQDDRRPDRSLTDPLTTNTTDSRSRIYRLMVDLPAGVPTTDEDAAEAAAENQEGGTSATEGQP
jgi:type II secretory pathway pseudopilin PulG